MSDVSPAELAQRAQLTGAWQKVLTWREHISAFDAARHNPVTSRSTV